MPVSAASLRAEVHNLRDRLIKEDLAVAYSPVVLRTTAQGTIVTHAGAGSAVARATAHIHIGGFNMSAFSQFRNRWGTHGPTRARATSQIERSGAGGWCSRGEARDEARQMSGGRRGAGSRPGGAHPGTAESAVEQRRPELGTLHTLIADLAVR